MFIVLTGFIFFVPFALLAFVITFGTTVTFRMIFWHPLTSFCVGKTICAVKAYKVSIFLSRVVKFVIFLNYYEFKHIAGFILLYLFATYCTFYHKHLLPIKKAGHSYFLCPPFPGPVHR